MGVFQGPPSIGTGPTGYSLGPGSGTSVVIGPGGATINPVIGPGGTRIQRPSLVERERDLRLVEPRPREYSRRPLQRKVQSIFRRCLRFLRSKKVRGISWVV